MHSKAIVFVVTANCFLFRISLYLKKETVYILYYIYGREKPLLVHDMAINVERQSLHKTVSRSGWKNDIVYLIWPYMIIFGMITRKGNAYFCTTSHSSWQFWFNKPLNLLRLWMPIKIISFLSALYVIFVYLCQRSIKNYN